MKTVTKKTPMKKTVTPTVKTDKFNLRTELWSYEKFAKLDPYMMNRDVEPRVSRVVKTLSRKYLPIHSIVTVGRATKSFGKYKKGDLFRLDGNTRAEAYKVRPELIPEVPFNVIMVDIENKIEADEIYYGIDSSDAVETSSHKITGFLREREYDATSKVIKSGKFKTALDNACRYGHNEEGVYLQTAPFNVKLDYFWEELTYLDSTGILNPNDKRVSANVMTALLLISKKYGVNNKRFNILIENFKNGLTVTNNSTQVDGVHHVINDLYTKNILVWKTTGFGNSLPLISKILNSFDKFVQNETIKKPIKTMSDKKLAEYYQHYLSV